MHGQLPGKRQNAGEKNTTASVFFCAVWSFFALGEANDARVSAEKLSCDSSRSAWRGLRFGLACACVYAMGIDPCRQEKPLKKSSFICANLESGNAMPVPPCRAVEAVTTSAPPPRVNAAENIFEKVLTLKKSVIRFRPNEASQAQRKRVRHRDETYNASVARPHPHREGRRHRFPPRNATRHFRHPRPHRRGCLPMYRSLRFGEGFNLIRSHAPGASAAACGSNSRGVCNKQLGIQRMYPSIVH